MSPNPLPLLYVSRCERLGRPLVVTSTPAAQSGHELATHSRGEKPLYGPRMGAKRDAPPSLPSVNKKPVLAMLFWEGGVVMRP